MKIKIVKFDDQNRFDDQNQNRQNRQINVKFDVALAASKNLQKMAVLKGRQGKGGHRKSRLKV